MLHLHRILGDKRSAQFILQFLNALSSRELKLPCVSLSRSLTSVRANISF